MFFNSYHKVIVKYKYFRKSFSLEALEAAGSGTNLGFNYSHLENWGSQAGPSRFFSQIHEKQSIPTTTFGSTTAQEICSNYSIRRWSFLFILHIKLLHGK
jgi:hypothetical protein